MELFTLNGVRVAIKVVLVLWHSSSMHRICLVVIVLIIYSLLGYYLLPF
jgi:hypothetical protein